jgi:hypothetical protein
MKFKTCEVGLFRLPGVVFDKESMTDLLMTEIDEWAESEQGTGKRMTEILWSFKTESQRDWFILRWSDV